MRKTYLAFLFLAFTLMGCTLYNRATEVAETLSKASNAVSVRVEKAQETLAKFGGMLEKMGGLAEKVGVKAGDAQEFISAGKQLITTATTAFEKADKDGDGKVAGLGEIGALISLVLAGWAKHHAGKTDQQQRQEIAAAEERRRASNREIHERLNQILAKGA